MIRESLREAMAMGNTAMMDRGSFERAMRQIREMIRQHAGLELLEGLRILDRLVGVAMQ